MTFFTKANLCCTNSLSTKHTNAQGSNNIWVFIVMDLLQLIMTSNKKLGVGFEDKLGLFPTHDVLKSSIKVLTKIECPCFSIFSRF